MASRRENVIGSPQMDECDLRPHYSTSSDKGDRDAAEEIYAYGSWEMVATGSHVSSMSNTVIVSESGNGPYAELVTAGRHIVEADSLGGGDTGINLATTLFGDFAAIAE